jgi:hypothetical protein
VVRPEASTGGSMPPPPEVPGTFWLRAGQSPRRPAHAGVSARRERAGGNRAWQAPERGGGMLLTVRVRTRPPTAPGAPGRNLRIHLLRPWRGARPRQCGVCGAKRSSGARRAGGQVRPCERGAVAGAEAREVSAPEQRPRRHKEANMSADGATGRPGAQSEAAARCGARKERREHRFGLPEGW